MLAVEGAHGMGAARRGTVVLVLAADAQATPTQLRPLAELLHHLALPAAISLPLDAMATADWPAGALAGYPLIPQLAHTANEAARRPLPHHTGPPAWQAAVTAAAADVRRLTDDAIAPGWALGEGPLLGELLAYAAAAGLPVCVDSPVAGEGPGEPLCLAHALLCRPVANPLADAKAGPTEWAAGWDTLQERATPASVWPVVLPADLPLALLTAFLEWLAATAGGQVAPVTALPTWRGQPAPLPAAELPRVCHEVGLRLHPVPCSGQWWSMGEIFSALVQVGVAQAAGQPLPVSLTPAPLLGPLVASPMLAEVLARREDVLGACAVVHAHCTATGCVPAVVAVGRHTVMPTSFLYALAHVLMNSEASLKIPAGPLPILDATRRGLRQYADHLAVRPHGGPWLRQRLLDHCWSAKPPTPPG